MDPPEPLRFIQAWSSRYNKFLTISRPYTLYHTLRPEIMDKSRKTYGFILQSVQHPELLHNPCPKYAPIRRQKLSNIRPTSLGQASRISGVSPADVSVLMIYLETKKQA
jgi:tRNA U34 5-carboxymethylaminomethyl modifying enzyme MnmG/GidA